MDWDIYFRGSWIESFSTATDNPQEAKTYCRKRYKDQGPMHIEQVDGDQKIEIYK